MKFLLLIVLLYIIAYSLAQPLEQKSDTEKSTKPDKNIKATKTVNEQNKKDNVKVFEIAEEKQDKKQGVKYNSKNNEKLKGAESVYHSLPMPFVHYPFPFVNSYTTRYFPYGYAGVGFDNVLGYGGLGYAYGYGGWF